MIRVIRTQGNNTGKGGDKLNAAEFLVKPGIFYLTHFQLPVLIEKTKNIFLYLL